MDLLLTGTGKAVGRTGLEEKITSSKCKLVFSFVTFEMWIYKWRCLVDSLIYEFGVQGRNPRRRCKCGCHQYLDGIQTRGTHSNNFLNQGVPEGYPDASTFAKQKVALSFYTLHLSPLPRNLNKKHEVSLSKHLT